MYFFSEFKEEVTATYLAHLVENQLFPQPQSHASLSGYMQLLKQKEIHKAFNQMFLLCVSLQK